MSNDIKEAMKERDKHLKRACRWKCRNVSDDWPSYRCENNKITNLIKKAKQNFFLANQSMKIKETPRGFGIYLNSLIEPVNLNLKSLISNLRNLGARIDRGIFKQLLC